MCGICGFIERRSSTNGHAETLAPMLARIAHRGPDGEGRSVDDSGAWTVSLGHRRLSIIDLETGAQPMASERAKITYNGELYNFRELRHAPRDRAGTCSARRAIPRLSSVT